MSTTDFSLKIQGKLPIYSKPRVLVPLLHCHFTGNCIFRYVLEGVENLMNETTMRSLYGSNSNRWIRGGVYGELQGQRNVATVHGVVELDTTERLILSFFTIFISNIKKELKKTDLHITCTSLNQPQYTSL